MSWWAWVLVVIAILAILFALVVLSVQAAGKALAKGLENVLDDYLGTISWNR